jgi:bifunctional non-homologous end joining protein LigD
VSDATDWVATARPMLASSNEYTLADLAGRYIFDEKVDGVRAMMAVGPEGFRIINRNGVDRTDRYPDLAATATQFQYDAVLDGEIVLLDESLGFEGIARRDKQQSPAAIARAATQTPAKFVAFDVLRIDGNPTSLSPWSDRRRWLMEVMSHRPPNFRTSHWSNDPIIYDKLMSEGKEGVVAKLSTSPYTPGRSSAWLKHKAKYRLTAVVVGYEPGTGKRRECGKFILALLDDDAVPVRLGVVGSGFTDADLVEYKTRLDSGRMWLAEIETMGLTDSGALRQPIFKGERTDLSILDASTTQLKTLPKGTTAP